jgi:hypothetical protein
VGVTPRRNMPSIEAEVPIGQESMSLVYRRPPIYAVTLGKKKRPSFVSDTINKNSAPHVAGDDCFRE